MSHPNQDPRLNYSAPDHYKGDAPYVGHVVEAPRVNQTQNGNKVASTRVQICRLGRADSQGGQRPIHHDTINVKAWGTAAESLAQAQPGQTICFFGGVENESWTDNNSGEKKWKTVINANAVFLHPGPSRYPMQGQAQQQQQQQQHAPQAQGYGQAYAPPPAPAPAPQYAGQAYGQAPQQPHPNAWQQPRAAQPQAAQAAQAPQAQQPQAQQPQYGQPYGQPQNAPAYGTPPPGLNDIPF